MSIKSLELPEANAFERRDLLLEQAFIDATDGTIVAPNRLQQALFPRLATQDTGLLVLTGPSAGRLEAVVVPVLTGAPSDDQLHRLFIIAADHTLVDDYIYRLAPYLRSLAVARGQSFTIFVEATTPFCRKYLPDGSYVDCPCNHPLDVCVDLVVARFSAFRSFFFGAGGVHALPGKLERVGDTEPILDARRRDLFYFDEAQSYDLEEFRSFLKLVEFLYAEDVDVLIGSTTLPEACREELSFLEHLHVEEALKQPGRLIINLPVEKAEWESVITNLVKERYFESSRLGVVLDNAEDVEALHETFSRLYPQGVFRYCSTQPMNERLKIYAAIRELEKEGEGYLLISNGEAFENADLDVNLLITSVCAPELLIRRAGRCNRRGDLVNGEIVVLGSEYSGRQLAAVLTTAYLDALKSCSERTAFSAEFWKTFIV